ncbi:MULTISPECIES: NAD(P)/FAD-dependent oxidoreductase [Acinetobacter calcoaceticus/baumannii complex]|uniref:NAD(P)/FAD-dependent oxidoreductase n=1 Tax=Acinetobacter calcoaceticus/baumannii complex TaxID=909768 RepID=UPI00119F9065|nr:MULTISPECIES: FAD-dependent oxidoreductase [Acinetobacter calcoaceticus/baumannii complex]MBD0476731.1 FAD-binding oxidoreductase [Acinetobacter baumannii]MCP9174354.1 FAD-binding oxidoreductase [Acinetobacter baumannii]MCZ2937050.1 FAD-binding oxidoreductase [Acinetobacter baumannii]MDQ8923214.1 FAD-dependent oxidoreductase [Acinetobacter baumannii]MDQ8926611.1 FAD-dependent oxidoreductase [Acinetobacter baumannii]
MNIIIIGAGIIGASIFNELTEKYKNHVTIIEQGRIAELGATSVSGGILRCFERTSELVEQAKYSLNKYKNFQDYANAKSVFVESGCVYPIYKDRDIEEVKYLIKQMESKINLEFIDRFQLETLLPNTNWKDYLGAILEKEAGHFCPKYATKSLINFGLSKGGIVLENTKCLQILHTNNQIKGIKTGLKTLEADIVIVCSGAWSTQLAEKSGIDVPKHLVAKAIQMARFKNDNQIINHAPAFIDDKSGLYGRSSNLNQLMIGLPTEEWNIEPDSFDGHNEDHFKKIFSAASHIWKLDPNDFNGHIRMFDAYTSDEKPIVQSSNLEGLFWATGFNGGGFKFAPSIAKEISELVN